MGKSYQITEEQKKIIEEARHKNKDKKVEKRLHGVWLRACNEKNGEIAKKLDVHPKVVSAWVSAFVNNGIEALTTINYGGNRRNMTYEEEAEILKPFEELAEKGQIVEVSKIKAAYEEKVDHEIGNSQIYRVLERHKWRKVMPRSVHPKKASEEAIEASKKLTQK
jgi:transposase